MITYVVFGASGDLARKKTFPAIFNLHARGDAHPEIRTFGYARSSISTERFRDSLRETLLKKQGATPELVARFLSSVHYVQGQYDSAPDFCNLKGKLASASEGAADVYVFYLAVPPSVFLDVAQNVREVLYSPSHQNRVVIEKPFGKDLASVASSNHKIRGLFCESDIFRIDHYLGKEMVKSILTLRFSNMMFSSSWGRAHIDLVQIVFKEDFGIFGRGGYFDEYGIIRDIIQNHLLQVLAICAMDQPASMSSTDIRNEKPSLNDVVLGQYSASIDGTHDGYTEEPGVSPESRTPTFAAIRMLVNNERWAGVPFILKAGKGLNESKVEVRIQFRDVPGSPFGLVDRNELVIRIQPRESIYLKVNIKRPGFENELMVSELDLSYSKRYSGLYIPEAYESLLKDVVTNDHSNFVREDELLLSWKVFDKLLSEIDSLQPRPLKYSFGTRGPAEADVFIKDTGFQRNRMSYVWAQ